VPQRTSRRTIAKSGKTAKDAKSENSDFRRFLLFFLGDLGALGGSKIDFAILLAPHGEELT